jgi:hypothetical protein
MTQEYLDTLEAVMHAELPDSELCAYKNEDGFQVWQIAPEIELIATFYTQEDAEDYITKQFN